MKKLNDLSKSKLRDRFLDKDFKAETIYAITFGRVSLKKNKDSGNSDEDQRETMQNYVVRHGLVILREWDVAETASKHDRRKHFKEMLEYIDKNLKIKHIVFSHQSRSNRNRESARALEFLVRNKGITIHCVRDGLTLNAKSGLEQWMQWDIFNALNEKFIDDHRKNVVGGTIKRIEQGWFPGKAPIGYRNVRPHESAQSTIEIDTESASFVVKAFELFASGQYSLPRLMQELNDKFSYLAINGKKPSVKYIEKLLKNPFYYGTFDYSGCRYNGAHKPLITFSLWQKAQDAFKIRGWKKKCTKNNRAFTGLIRCGGHLYDQNGLITNKVCGCAITPEVQILKLKDGSESVHEYYRCSRSTGRCTNKDKDFLKRSAYFKASEIVEMMGPIFQQLEFTKDDCSWIQNCLLKQHEDEKKDLSARVSALKSRLSMLETYINKTYEDHITGKINQLMWDRMNTRYLSEQEQVRSQLVVLDDEKQDYIAQGVRIIESCEGIESTFKNANMDEKRRMVDLVSLNLTLADGTIRFDYRKPFDILAKSKVEQNWWTKPANKQPSQAHVIIELPYCVNIHSRDKIAEYYRAGMSLRAIECQLHIPKTTARKVLIEDGVAIRTSANNQSKCQSSPLGMKSGTTPYGFTYLEGKLVIDPHEYKNVLEIYRLRQKEKSFRAIARSLNERGCRTRLAKKWTNQIIKRVYDRHLSTLTTKRRK